MAILKMKFRFWIIVVIIALSIAACGGCTGSSTDIDATIAAAVQATTQANSVSTESPTQSSASTPTKKSQPTRSQESTPKDIPGPTNTPTPSPTSIPVPAIIPSEELAVRAKQWANTLLTLTSDYDGGVRRLSEFFFHLPLEIDDLATHFYAIWNPEARRGVVTELNVGGISISGNTGEVILHRKATLDFGRVREFKDPLQWRRKGGRWYRDVTIDELL